MKKSLMIKTVMLLITCLYLCACNKISPKETTDKYIEAERKLFFIDESILMENALKSTIGLDRLEYIKSYYIIQESIITKYDIGKEDSMFLESVAKGVTRENFSYDKKISGKVLNFGTSNSDIIKLINLYLTGNEEGIITRTGERKATLRGPNSDSVFSSRHFYCAINHDVYEFKISRYNIYSVIKDGKDTGKTQELNTTNITIKNIQSPKVIHYSIDK
ncbi:hypothetical protein PV797_00050 [Clostridiaceae bacterium M8S5]|nr:hypothetical protein PV797_00050 [Clostridiaceae bacterium M8S5]